MPRDMRFLLALLILTQPVFADGLGINFAAFPPGTKFYYRDSADGPFVERYLGMQEGRHAVARHLSHEFSEVVLTRYYSAEGLEVGRSYASGREVSYEPFNCERGLGRCSHEVVTDRGARRVSGKVLEDPDGYRFELTFEGASDTRRRYFRLGQHGVMEFIRENDRQRKLESIERP
ncbi:MAG: hypothetical protein AAGI10_00270 [Pseudomonadota bacterium]